MIEPSLAALAEQHSLEPGVAERLQAYAERVRAAPHNLVSRHDRERVIERHIADSLEGLQALQTLPLLDLGSGAGFPGLVLACCIPLLPVTLVEASQRKASFLRKTAEVLELDRVNVLNERTESLGRKELHREAYGQLSARALAPLASLLELAAPLTRLNGLLLAWKGSRADDELLQALPAAETLGWATQGRAAYRLADGIPRAILRLVKRKPTPERFPRKPGKAAKSPIGK